MGNIIALLFVFTLVSVSWDICMHDHRMDRWEKKHPGKRYIRNYRKLNRRGLILK
jgi:hypothetical protein